MPAEKDHARHELNEPKTEHAQKGGTHGKFARKNTRTLCKRIGTNKKTLQKKYDSLGKFAS